MSAARYSSQNSSLVACPVAELAAKSPDAPLILSGDTALRRGAFHHRVTGIKLELEKRLAGSSPVILRFPFLSPDYLAVMHALLRLGKMTILSDPHMPIKRLMALLKTRLGTELGEHFLCGVLREEEKSYCISASALPQMPFSLEELKSCVSLLPMDDTEKGAAFIDENMPSQIICTSGSTGLPKCVAITFAQHIKAAQESNQVLAFNAKKCWLLALPLHHISGLAIWMRTLASGARLVLHAAEHFDAKQMLAELARYHVTHVSLVPAQLFDLLKIDGAAEQLGRCECILLGGSHVPYELKKLAAKLPIVHSYGMSETLSHIALHRYGLDPKTSYSILPGKDVIVKNGMICIHQKNLASGYCSPNNELGFELDEEDYFHTDDMGSFDDTGALCVKGRIGNSITSGGETFSCEEVEQVLARVLTDFFAKELAFSFPYSLRLCFVTGLPHDKWGNVPMAVLGWEGLGGGASVFLNITETQSLSRAFPTQTQLRSLLSQDLETYKHPVAYYLFNQNREHRREGVSATKIMDGASRNQFMRSPFFRSQVAKWIMDDHFLPLLVCSTPKNSVGIS